MPAADPLDSNKIDVTKNSAANVSYYENLGRAYERDDSPTLQKLRSFALYAPRQVVTDFLVRYELFKLIADVPGSIFEFGVFNGQGLLSYAQFSAIIEPNNISRRIFGFDTFEGFPTIVDADRTSRSSFVHEGGYAVASEDRIRQAIDLFDQNRFIGHVPKVELVRGDVAKSLPQFLGENPHAIPALIHLDVDLYEPTKIALELMLPRMPAGAVVVFDELNLKDFPGETVALLDSLPINKIALKRLPFCSRISYFRVGA